MQKILMATAMVLLFLGAAGVMNETGNIQIVPCVMCIIGAVGMVILGREFYWDE